MNVDAMLRSITSAQFLEWMEFAGSEPFGDRRSDYHAAQIVQMLAAVNRSSKSAPLPSLDKFVLKFGQPKKKQTWQEQKMIAQMITALYNSGK